MAGITRSQLCRWFLRTNSFQLALYIFVLHRRKKNILVAYKWLSVLSTLDDGCSTARASHNCLHMLLLELRWTIRVKHRCQCLHSWSSPVTSLLKYRSIVYAASCHAYRSAFRPTKREDYDNNVLKPGWLNLTEKVSPMPYIFEKMCLRRFLNRRNTFRTSF